MRLVTITAAALALSTSVALAQMAPTPGGLSTTPGGSGGLGGPGVTQAPHVPAVNPLTAEDVSRISGTAVYGSDDKKIGSISNVLMKPENKQIDRLVVAQGGLLGVGAHHVALPVDQFKWDQQKEGFQIAKSTDDLKSMAEWQDPARSTTSGAGSSTPPARVEMNSPPAR
jgi:sporulation protein YlmC with PRC-barrel domain